MTDDKRPGFVERQVRKGVVAFAAAAGAAGGGETISNAQITKDEPPAAGASALNDETKKAVVDKVTQVFNNKIKPEVQKRIDRMQAGNALRTLKEGLEWIQAQRRVPTIHITDLPDLIVRLPDDAPGHGDISKEAASNAHKELVRKKLAALIYKLPNGDHEHGNRSKDEDTAGKTLAELIVQLNNGDHDFGYKNREAASKALLAKGAGIVPVVREVYDELEARRTRGEKYFAEVHLRLELLLQHYYELERLENEKLKEALNPLHKYPECAPEAVPLLRKALDQKNGVQDHQFLCHALITLDKFGPKAIDALPEIMAFLPEIPAEPEAKDGKVKGDPRLQPFPEDNEHPDALAAWLVKHSLNTIAAIGPGAKEAWPKIVQLIEIHPDVWTRKAAVDALKGIGPIKEAQAPLINALDDPERDVRGKSAVALNAYGPEAEPTVEALCKIVADPQEQGWARGAAIKTLGDIGSLKAVDSLVELFIHVRPDDEKSSERKPAAEALGKIIAAQKGGGPKAVRRDIEDVLLSVINEKTTYKDMDLQVKCVEVLVNMGAGAEHLPAIEKIGDALFMIAEQHSPQQDDQPVDHHRRIGALEDKSGEQLYIAEMQNRLEAAARNVRTAIREKERGGRQ